MFTYWYETSTTANPISFKAKNDRTALNKIANIPNVVRLWRRIRDIVKVLKG